MEWINFVSHISFLKGGYCLNECDLSKVDKIFNHTSAYFGIYLNYYFAAFMHYLTLIFLPSSFNRTDMVNKLESLCSKVSNLKNPQYGYYCCKSFFPAYFYNWKISRYSESWLVSKTDESRVTLLYVLWHKMFKWWSCFFFFQYVKTCTCSIICLNVCEIFARFMFECKWWDIMNMYFHITATLLSLLNFFYPSPPFPSFYS